MKRYISEMFSIMSLMLITIACNFNNGNANNQKNYMKDTLVIVGCQEKISMEVGSIVEIKLEATPGTGYQWLLMDSSLLLKQLEADNLKFSTGDTKQDTPGQNSFQILLFKAMKKGEGKVQLEYKRTFEKEIMKSCVIEIEIT